MIKPEEIVSLHLHPQFQPLSLAFALAYPLQDTDTVIVRPSPHVASAERSLECLSEPPARLQDNDPIVSLFQHPEFQPMALYPKAMVFHSSPVTVTIRGQSQESHYAAYEDEGQAAVELTHPKRPAAAKSAASRKPKKAKVFTPPQDNARQKSKAVIDALNAASGGKNDRAAALAAKRMRGITKRPSGMWVSCNTES
jgi:hypothetical protein